MHILSTHCISCYLLKSCETKTGGRQLTPTTTRRAHTDSFLLMWSWPWSGDLAIRNSRIASEAIPARQKLSFQVFRTREYCLLAVIASQLMIISSHAFMALVINCSRHLSHAIHALGSVVQKKPGGPMPWARGRHLAPIRNRQSLTLWFLNRTFSLRLSLKLFVHQSPGPLR